MVVMPCAYALGRDSENTEAVPDERLIDEGVGVKLVVMSCAYMLGYWESLLEAVGSGMPAGAIAGVGVDDPG